MRAYQANRNEVQVVAHSGQLELRQFDGGEYTTPASVEYDAEAHAWWRLSAEDGDLIFSVSPDGDEWEEVDRIPDPFGTTPVWLVLGARNVEGIAEPGRARFRSLNLAAP